MTRPITEQFKAAIAKAERRGMTRYAIGKLSGVGRGNLSRYCSGEIVPKLDTAEKIIKAIGGRIVIELDEPRRGGS